MKTFVVKTYLVLAGLFLLSGCISLIPEAGPGPDIYRLSSVPEHKGAKTGGAVVLLPVVQAPKELRNNRVALILQPQTISYAANARWAAATPEMLQSLLADTFRERNFMQVVLPADGLDAPIEVRVSLQNFEAYYDQGQAAPPLARVGFRVQLIDRVSRTLLGEQKFVAQARSKDVRLGSIVAAIDEATHNTASQISHWVMTSAISSPAMSAQ